METTVMKEKESKLTFSERKQDLFTMGKEYVLVHCVSTDCALGAGIAKDFRRLIPEMPDVLKGMNPRVGDTIRFHTRGGRIVANLFTKERYNHKPTMESLAITLFVLRRMVRKEGYTYLAMPQIGCGLDKLNWKEVRELIQEVFKEDDIEIVICSK